jgi:hypothetical protein
MQSNPFVVLSDVTISLAIMFLVFGIATAVTNTQILIFFDRNDRQLKIENQLIEALQRVLPGATTTRVRAPGDTRDHVELREQGTLVGVVWTNASFQRVQILKPTFDAGKTLPNELCKQFLRSVGDVVRGHSSDFSYLFLHGVTELAESKSLTASATQSISDERAKSALLFLDTPNSTSIVGMPRRYVIPYGTGNSLYLTKGASTGRVDFLMFYNDVQNTERK